MAGVGVGVDLFLSFGGVGVQDCGERFRKGAAYQTMRYKSLGLRPQ